MLGRSMFNLRRRDWLQIAMIKLFRLILKIRNVYSGEKLTNVVFMSFCHHPTCEKSDFVLISWQACVYGPFTQAKSGRLD